MEPQRQRRRQSFDAMLTLACTGVEVGQANPHNCYKNPLQKWRATGAEALQSQTGASQG